MAPPPVPPPNPVNTSSGPIQFSARRLALDWNISAALDVSPQTSSRRPWRVLLSSNDIGGSKYAFGYQFNGTELTYNRYCIQLSEDYVEYLLLEDQAIYMNFFDWMYKTSRKKLLQSYDENTGDAFVSTLVCLLDATGMLGFLGLRR
jgi:hypothetical protein